LYVAVPSPQSQSTRVTDPDVTALPPYVIERLQVVAVATPGSPCVPAVQAIDATSVVAGGVVGGGGLVTVIVALADGVPEPDTVAV
jgi:hypothetical protein